MTQFGVGPELAAQCPRASTPDGWRAWLEADGPIPDALAKRAAALVADESLPLGTTESYPLPGVTALLRLEPHVWSGGAQGCFRSTMIYLPDSSPEGAGIRAPEESGAAKAVTILTALSLAVGTAATLATWKKRRAA